MTRSNFCIDHIKDIESLCAFSAGGIAGTLLTACFPKYVIPLVIGSCAIGGLVRAGCEIEEEARVLGNHVLLGDIIAPLYPPGYEHSELPQGREQGPLVTRQPGR